MEKQKGITISDEGDVYADHTYSLSTYSGVSLHKSVWRAMRRGTASPTGIPYPHRPFSNSKATRGRNVNEHRKALYFLYKSKDGGR